MAETVSIYDLVEPLERLVYCSWCGAEPGNPCQEWEKPIERYHGQRTAHLHDLQVALVAPALKDAGSWLGQQRRLGGRRYANAEMFGEAIYNRGADIEYQSEVAAKRIRFALSSTSEGATDDR